jgi:hypothetical protein
MKRDKGQIQQMAIVVYIITRFFLERKGSGKAKRVEHDVHLHIVYFK